MSLPLTIVDDTPLFSAIRAMVGPMNQKQVDSIKAALLQSTTHAPPPPPPPKATGRDMSARAISNLKTSEALKLKAYPDPGSRDGTPWTIGYGATGAGIKRGTVWTKEQAEAWLIDYIRNMEDQIEKLLGNAATSQAQFDALCHFTYNVGSGKLASSTLLAKHLAGDYAGAADQFGRWIYNDGKKMKGLVTRRNYEKAMYLGQI